MNNYKNHVFNDFNVYKVSFCGIWFGYKFRRYYQNVLPVFQCFSNYFFNSTNHIPSKSTLMRSRMREDLNIQSSLASSLSNRSSKLPREQYSVTMANTPQSWKKPRKGLKFSCLISFIWNIESNCIINCMIKEIITNKEHTNRMS